ncbi:hypothetical protein [Paraburkholderia flagellata]|uniref:hypothetical protein n=1 Tax=Paraburkholderia flagellata TaxID=2883241 RepID=UPI001F463A31|nr:hypothetical protein [Paraburkholderia flagellata]
MENNFKTLRDAGITVIRMWLMGNGANYDGTVEVGFANDRGNFWDFHPPASVDKSFLEDFALLLNICRQANVQIIPVLIDFAFFDEPKGDLPLGAGRFVPTHGDWPGGRRSIAENPSIRREFIIGTLEPILKIAAANKDVIYAFEVINEPGWCIYRFTGSLFGKSLKPNDMMAFLSECVASIKAYGLKSTIGHRYLSDIYGEFSSVKVDLPQHHYYASKLFDSLNGKYPSTRIAKIIGEFGSITASEFDALKDRASRERDPTRKKILDRQVSDFDLQKNQWPDLSNIAPLVVNLPRDTDPSTILELRLQHLDSLGYQLAIIWPSPVDPDRETIDDLKLDSQKLQSVRRFTGR